MLYHGFDFENYPLTGGRRTSVTRVLLASLLYYFGNALSGPSIKPKSLNLSLPPLPAIPSRIRLN